jgi:hypothetical protein
MPTQVRPSEQVSTCSADSRDTNFASHLSTELEQLDARLEHVVHDLRRHVTEWEHDPAQERESIRELDQARVLIKTGEAMLSNFILRFR